MPSAVSGRCQSELNGAKVAADTLQWTPWWIGKNKRRWLDCWPLKLQYRRRFYGLIKVRTKGRSWTKGGGRQRLYGVKKKIGLNIHMRREIGIYIYTNVLCCCKVNDNSFSNVKENQVLMRLKSSHMQCLCWRRNPPSFKLVDDLNGTNLLSWLGATLPYVTSSLLSTNGNYYFQSQANSACQHWYILLRLAVGFVSVDYCRIFCSLSTTYSHD